MTYLLDTDICIFIIKEKPPEVIAKFRHFRPMEIAISAISVAELEFGIEKSRFIEKNRLALTHFLLPLEVLPFDAEDAKFYGSLRYNLQSRGLPIGSMDLLIAAQALRQNLTLVSNNIKEFSRIAELRLENWM